MGIVFRQSVKTSIVILAGAFLGAFTNWLISFVLTMQVVGMHRYLSTYSGIVHFFALLGIGPAIAAFMPRYAPDSPKRQALLRVGMLLPLVTVGLFTLAYFALRSQIVGLYQIQEDRALLDRFYHLLPPLVFLSCYVTLLDVYLVSQHRSAVASFAREIVQRLAVLAALLLYFLGYIGLSGFLWSLMGMLALSGLAMLPAALRTPGFGFRRSPGALSRKEWKDISSYAWYHLLSGAGLILVSQLDGMMLGVLSPRGLESVAVYVIAGFLAALMNAPFRAMVNAAFPTVNIAYSSGDMERVGNLYDRAAVNILIAGVAMGVIIVPNLSNAARFFAKGYEELAPVALVLILGRLADMATGLNELILSVSPYYRFNFRSSVLLIAVMATLCYLLIPHYGPVGAAWAGTLSVAAFNTARSWYLWRKLRLRPLPRGAAKVALAGLLAGGVAWALPHIPSEAVRPRDAAHYLRVLADASIRATVAMAIYGALIVWLRPSPDLAGMVARLRRRQP